MAELSRAAYNVGAILPSIGLDLTSMVGGTPLISVGRINLETAQALIKALNRVAAAATR